MNNITYNRWTYLEFDKHIDAIKTLRKCYNAFPYLYKYDDTQENKYLNSYLSTKEKLDAFCAFDQDQLIAISIGCPLSKEIEITEGLFSFNINTDHAYYFGDIIVNPEYQKKGIANQLYSLHLDYIKGKGFKRVYALIVNRDNDERKPSNYTKPNLWEKYHFSKTGNEVAFSWDTYQKDGLSKMESNVLELYEKNL